MYPGFMQDKTLSSQVNECEAYGLAASHEQAGNWGEAYECYQDYSTTYPNGLYAAEAHQHSATALINMVQDQVEAQQYREALANLNLIVSEYSDTSVSAGAWALFPSIYTAWGTGLRESADFEQAQQVFNDFKTWSQSNQKTESETVAQSESAQTYLDWGLALQSQKQFEQALAKFDLALSADSQSQFDSSAQARIGQIGVYIDWGNDLVGQKNFAFAIEKFELAVSLSDATNADSANDALANGYVQWALGLSADEDFRGALEQLDVANKIAATDAMKQSVETAEEEIYLAFSNSSGPQAQRAIKDAIKAICEEHKKPALPIFGLNKDSVLVGTYGLDVRLPDDLAARTPGELHYIACVDVEEFAIESRRDSILQGVTPIQARALEAQGVEVHHRPVCCWIVRSIIQTRIKILWHVNLHRSDTVEAYKEKTFAGGPPPFYPSDWKDWGDGNYYGTPPDVFLLIEWLQSANGCCRS
jgi:tetratricopeptide (TPR) repeat protein